MATNTKKKEDEQQAPPKQMTQKEETEYYFDNAENVPDDDEEQQQPQQTTEQPVTRPQNEAELRNRIITALSREPELSEKEETEKYFDYSENVPSDNEDDYGPVKNQQPDQPVPTPGTKTSAAPQPTKPVEKSPEEMTDKERTEYYFDNAENVPEDEDEQQPTNNTAPQNKPQQTPAKTPKQEKETKNQEPALTERQETERYFDNAENVPDANDADSIVVKQGRGYVPLQPGPQINNKAVQSNPVGIAPTRTSSGQQTPIAGVPAGGAGTNATMQQPSAGGVYSSPEEMAYDKYGRAILEAGQQQLANQNKIGKAYINALNKEVEALERADNEFLDAMKANAAQNNNAFGDYVKKKLEDLENAKKESEILDKEELKPAIWTNVAELANSIINLTGVSLGASNMQFQTFSQDWMKKADANRKERRRRIDALREKLDAAQLKLQDIKSSGAKSVAELQYKTEAAAAGRRKNIADAQYKVDSAMATTAATNATKAAEMSLKAATEARKAAREDAKDIRDERELAMKEKYYGSRTKTGDETKKGKNMLTLPVAANPDKNLPEEVFQIDKESLLATLATNIDALTDLSEEDLDVIKKIIRLSLGAFGKKESEELMRMIQKSEQLRHLIRRAIKYDAVRDSLNDDGKDKDDKASEEKKDEEDTGLGNYE